MPFVTEDIYHQLRERNDDITVKQFSVSAAPEAALLARGELLKEVITAIRDARNKAQIKPKESIRLHILSANPATYESIENILIKQVNAETVSYTKEAIHNAIDIVVQNDKFFIETTSVIDTASQKAQLQKDLDYLRGFLVAVDKKLSNERFVQNAKPDVIEVERKKKADAEGKIKAIEESLSRL